MKLLGKMFALVADKFKDKLDKGGKPYILHCIYVMEHCGSSDENPLCIALGHDLVEDIEEITYEYLLTEFNFEIAMGISTLSHNTNTSYDDYIKTIAITSSTMPCLRLIKLADLQHNTQVSRMKGLTKKDFDRLEKYHRAYTYLSKI